jgi:hypothetical protein
LVVDGWADFTLVVGDVPVLVDVAAGPLHATRQESATTPHVLGNDRMRVMKRVCA